MAKRISAARAGSFSVRFDLWILILAGMDFKKLGYPFD